MPVADDFREGTRIPPPRFVRGPDIDSISYPQLDYRPTREHRLGKGYRAEVYEATVAGTNQVVALKRAPKRRTLSRTQVERLLHGAKLGTRVSDHPYVATIFDYDRHPFPWIAFEYIDGGPLDDTAPDMNPEQRLWTAYAISDAVAHVNLQGVGHHDVTPSNVLLARTPGDFWPAPKLVDWGEAQKLQADRTPERITEEYAAPEMREGTLPGEALGYESDVYQTAVVCYELLTGELPDHPGRSIAPPSSIAPVPPELDDPIRNALSLDPDQRRHTLSLRDSLERVLKDRLDEADGQRETRSGPRRSPNVATGGASPVQQSGSESHAVGRDRAGVAGAALGLDGAWPAFGGSVRRTGQAKPGSGLGGGLSPAWHFETDRELRSSPVVADGSVFFGDKEGTIHALSIRDGRKQWSHRTASRVHSSPAVSQEAVYVGSQDRHVYALERDDGKVLWEFETRGWVDSSPVVSNGDVYVGSDDFSLYSLDARDGSLNWEYDTNGAVSMSAPAVADGTVYVAGDSGTLHAVDVRTGLREWTFETQFLLPSTPAVADGTVYVGGSQNRLYAVDAEDGSLEWSFSTGDDVRTSPAVGEGTVVFGSDDGTIYGVDADDGAELWRRSTENWIRSSPTIGGGNVFVGTCTGSFLIFDLTNGDIVDSFDVGGWVTTSPAVTEYGVFVGCESGLYAFGTGN